MSCGLIVHRCADCKQEFIGSWAEWYCQKCKDKRNLLCNTYYRKNGKKTKEMEHECQLWPMQQQEPSIIWLWELARGRRFDGRMSRMCRWDEEREMKHMERRNRYKAPVKYMASVICKDAHLNCLNYINVVRYLRQVKFLRYLKYTVLNIITPVKVVLWIWNGMNGPSMHSRQWMTWQHLSNSTKKNIWVFWKIRKRKWLGRCIADHKDWVGQNTETLR